MADKNIDNTTYNQPLDSYESFLINNRVRINHYLGIALWVCALTGPAIAIGIFFHAFKDVTYLTCLVLSAVIIILALIYMIFVRHYPHSLATCMYAFVVLDILLIYMAYSHIYIRLTWFLVPLLSLVFCSYRIYFASVLITYVTMCISLYISAPFFTDHRADISSFTLYFTNVLTGSTIEMVLMTLAGIGILWATHRYLKEIFNKYEGIAQREKLVHDSVSTLKSMAGIYDKVNLLNFKNMTEISLQMGGGSTDTLSIEGHDHTHLVTDLKRFISPDQLDSFWEFTDLTTLRQRLLENKSIYGEFINIVSGWFRAQYITVEKDEEGLPLKIIFTVQDIERDKRKESNLIKIANTDELTRLYNRRRYDDDILFYRENGLDEGFTLLSADVNGLKITNDTKGHAAGDELIKGAAECLHSAVAPYGKVYRTGGDEFIAILHLDDYEVLSSEVEARTRIWHGEYSDKLSISMGCASSSEYPNASIDELERIADSRMYEAKELYYKQAGIDRRKK